MVAASYPKCSLSARARARLQERERDTKLFNCSLSPVNVLLPFDSQVTSSPKTFRKRGPASPVSPMPCQLASPRRLGVLRQLTGPRLLKRHLSLPSTSPQPTRTAACLPPGLPLQQSGRHGGRRRAGKARPRRTNSGISMGQASAGRVLGTGKQAGEAQGAVAAAATQRFPGTQLRLQGALPAARSQPQQPPQHHITQRTVTR